MAKFLKCCSDTVCILCIVATVCLLWSSSVITINISWGSGANNALHSWQMPGRFVHPHAGLTSNYFKQGNSAGTDRELRQGDSTRVFHANGCMNEYQMQLANPHCPARAALAPTDAWQPVDMDLMVDGKWFGSVMPNPTLVAWARQEVIFRRRPCSSAIEEARAHTLMPFDSSAERVLSNAALPTREKLQIAVGLAELDYSNPESVYLSALSAAANVLQMLQSSGWSKVPPFVTVDVRTETWDGSNGDAFFPVDKRSPPWLASPNITARLEAPHASLGELTKRLKHQLVQLCPSQLSEPHRKPEVSVTVEALHTFLKCFGFSEPERLALTQNCHFQVKDKWLVKSRLPLIITAPVTSPLVDAHKARISPTFCPSARWVQLRTLVLHSRGAFHTVPATQGAAPPILSLLSISRHPTPKSRVKLFDAVYSAVHQTARDLHFRGGFVSAQRVERVMYVASRADIIMVWDEFALPSILALPPWGGVLEFRAENSSSTSSVHSFASLLGVAHTRLNLSDVSMQRGMVLTEAEVAMLTKETLALAGEVSKRRQAWLKNSNGSLES